MTASTTIGISNFSTKKSVNFLKTGDAPLLTSSNVTSRRTFLSTILARFFFLTSKPINGNGSPKRCLRRPPTKSASSSTTSLLNALASQMELWVQLYKKFLNSFYSLQENRPKIFLTKQLKIKCNTSNNK